MHLLYPVVLLTKENRLPECTTEVIKTDGKILLLPRNFLNPEVSLQIISFIHKQINPLFPGGRAQIREQMSGPEIS